MNGGRHNFDDGGFYIGTWENGKAHGYGVCTGPHNQGIYAGSFIQGFEVSGTYQWPSGNLYEGQWKGGKRHGLGLERKDRWFYRGQFTDNQKGKYGIRECMHSGAKYTGEWTNGVQDGYGLEMYADGGTYQGQWAGGLRHGKGIRRSVPYSHACVMGTQHRRGSLTDDSDKPLPQNFGKRGGFVLVERPEGNFSSVKRTSLLKKLSQSRNSIMSGLRIRIRKHNRSTRSLKSMASTNSSANSTYTDSLAGGSSINGEFDGSTIDAADITSADHSYFHDINEDVTETYYGDWKNDQRAGHGMSIRSDGLKYEGEWHCNNRHGYGCTTYPNGDKEEGKWKNNVLVQVMRKRLGGTRPKLDRAIRVAQESVLGARVKCNAADSKIENAQLQAEAGDEVAALAKQEADYAKEKSNEFGDEKTTTNIKLRKQSVMKPSKLSSGSFLSSSRNTKSIDSRKEDGDRLYLDSSQTESVDKDYLGIPSTTDHFAQSADDLRYSKGGSDREHPSILRKRQENGGQDKGAANYRAHTGRPVTPDCARKFIKSGLSRVQRSFRVKRKGPSTTEKPSPTEEVVAKEEPKEAPVQPGFGDLLHFLSQDHGAEWTEGDGDTTIAALPPPPLLDDHKHKDGWEIPDLFLASPKQVESVTEDPAVSTPARANRLYKRDYIYQRRQGDYLQNKHVPMVNIGALPSSNYSTPYADNHQIDQRNLAAGGTTIQPQHHQEDNKRAEWLSGTELIAFVVLLNVGFTALFAQLLT